MTKIEHYRHRKTGVVVQVLFRDEVLVQFRLTDDALILTNDCSAFDELYEPAPPLPPARAIVAEGRTLVCRACGATGELAVDAARQEWGDA